AWAARSVPLPRDPRSPALPHQGALAPWAHWDGTHYVALALHGYDATTIQNTAFFPLYPLGIRLLSLALGDPVLAGLVISLASLLAAFVFVFQIAADGWGTPLARRTLLCLAFFPTAFFFNAVYTESLFLALSAGAIWAVRVRRDLLLACALAA